jgi:hypothetical protein
MFDADYEDWVQQQNDAEVGKQVREGKYDENYLRELKEEIKGQVDGSRPFDKRALKYQTKDSGKRFESPDGMVRDTSEGKPQFTLMFPKGIPFEDQLMTRVADLYHRGGVKYGPRNWEKSSTEEALAKHEDCLMRHVVKYLLGVEDGEDHAAAIVWNVNAVDLTRWKLKNTLLDGPALKSIDEFLDDPSDGVKRERPEFSKVEFAQGDELLDENNDWWRYRDGLWMWEHNTNYRVVWTALVKDRAPLYIQTGAYAGITVLKDGGITHDE